MNALEFADALDAYLDARDDWKSYNDDNEMGDPIPERVRIRVGEARARLVYAVATVLAAKEVP